MTVKSATMPFPVRLRTELKLDPVLLTIVMTLLLGGLVILASASITISDNVSGNPFFYVERQLLAAAIGAVAGLFCLFIPMRVWQSIGPLLLLVGLALLCVVLVPGVGYEVNGSTRWVRFGVMNLQVSEPARLCLLVYLAGYVVRQQKALREQFVGFLRPMLVLSLACALLLAEPDFGAAIVLTATALRLTGFLDPWADPYDSGFQLSQSLIAIGRGEWFGVGLGDGVQKLFYLPEAHTDFVFAVFAEEFGLLGSLVLIALFLALLWRICSLAMRAADAERFFEAYLAMGLGTWLGLQAFINVGVNMGLLPTKGLTLPLISYGRSSLIVTMAAIGLLLRIHHELAVDAKPVNRKRRRRK